MQAESTDTAAGLRGDDNMKAIITENVAEHAGNAPFISAGLVRILHVKKLGGTPWLLLTRKSARYAEDVYLIAVN